VVCRLSRMRRVLELPERTVYRKIIQAEHFLDNLEAQMLCLRVFTSVVSATGSIGRICAELNLLIALKEEVLDEWRGGLEICPKHSRWVRARAGIRTSACMV
jgi:hypothetical protein